SPKRRPPEETIMNALTRWDPFKEMDDLHSRWAKLFGLTPARASNEGKEALTVAEWAPAVDITEDDKEYLVKADLREVKKEGLLVETPVAKGVKRFARFVGHTGTIATPPIGVLCHAQYVFNHL